MEIEGVQESCHGSGHEARPRGRRIAMRLEGSTSHRWNSGHIYAAPALLGVALVAVLTFSFALTPPPPASMMSPLAVACRQLAAYLEEKREILAAAETRWVDGPEALYLDDLRHKVYLIENHTPQCKGAIP